MVYEPFIMGKNVLWLLEEHRVVKIYLFLNLAFLISLIKERGGECRVLYAITFSCPWRVQAGCGVGGLLGAIHAFNTGIPYVQKHIKGPKWLPFLVEVPSLLTLSAGSALFGGYSLPKFTQLTVTSYYAASSASHYGISLLTRHIEESYTSRCQKLSDDQLRLRKL